MLLPALLLCVKLLRLEPCNMGLLELYRKLWILYCSKFSTAIRTCEAPIFYHTITILVLRFLIETTACAAEQCIVIRVEVSSLFLCRVGGLLWFCRGETRAGRHLARFGGNHRWLLLCCFILLLIFVEHHCSITFSCLFRSSCLIIRMLWYRSWKKLHWLALVISRSIVTLFIRRCGSRGPIICWVDSWRGLQLCLR